MKNNFALNDNNFLNSLDDESLKMVEKVKILYLDWDKKYRFENLRADMLENLKQPNNLSMFRELSDI